MVGVTANKFLDHDPRRKAVQLLVAGAGRVSFGPAQGGAIDNADSVTILSANGVVDIVGQWAGQELWAIASAAGTQASVVSYLDPHGSGGSFQSEG